jgi:Domain of unknown function (DUF4835)
VKYHFLFFALLACLNISFAQELSVQVRVTTGQATTTDPKVFKSLEKAIEDFMNNQKWTDDAFEPQERIKCNIQVTIRKDNGNNSFEADLGVQAKRPVYGSSYETSLLSHLDQEFSFSYEQFQPIQFAKNTYTDNLTAVLSFYAYTILGLDYDSFAPNGGEPYLQTAQDIINQLPKEARDSRGWQDNLQYRNRFRVLENLLNPRMKQYRQAWYTYHRQGLDLMAENVENGKSGILKGVSEIGEANLAQPNGYIFQLFANAKASELIDIFRVADPSQREKIIQTMTKIDVANGARYKEMTN